MKINNNRFITPTFFVPFKSIFFIFNGFLDSCKKAIGDTLDLKADREQTIRTGDIFLFNFAKFKCFHLYPSPFLHLHDNGSIALFFHSISIGCSVYIIWKVPFINYFARKNINRNHKHLVETCHHYGYPLSFFVIVGRGCPPPYCYQLQVNLMFTVGLTNALYKSPWIFLNAVDWKRLERTSL